VLSFMPQPLYPPGKDPQYPFVDMMALSDCFQTLSQKNDGLCGLAVRVPGYRSRGPSSIPGATNFLRSSGSGLESIQPREYN
jgi:hypothetical protein